MKDSTSQLLSVGMLAGASLSHLPMCDQEKIANKAGQELRNLKLKGGYIAPKERRRLEERAGIGGEVVEQIVAKKIKRNGPCPCGSGLKYKKCCG